MPLDFPHDFSPSAVAVLSVWPANTAGVNLHVSYLLVGLEAELDWARIRGSSVLTPTVLGVPQASPLNATTNVDWDLSVRVRVGYAHENWLYYTTAGVVVLGASTDLTSVTGA